MICVHGEGVDHRIDVSEGRIKTFCTKCGVRICPCCLYPYPEISASEDNNTPTKPTADDVASKDT